MLHQSLQFHTYIYKRYLKKEACLFVSLHICLNVCLFDCLLAGLLAGALHLIYVLNLLKHQTHIVAIDCTILSQNICGLVPWRSGNIAQFDTATHITYASTIYEKQTLIYASDLENLCNRQKTQVLHHPFLFLQNINIHATLQPTIRG